MLSEKHSPGQTPESNTIVLHQTADTTGTVTETMTTLAKLLTIYFWVGTAALILLLSRIAQFYQLTTGVRTYHRLFWIPVTCFLAGMIRYVMIGGGFAGDVLGDLLFFFGGASLAVTGYFLLKLMTGGRK
jgi:hypothetical protein